MKRLAFSAIADIAVIVVFVAIGREEHNSGNSIVGLLETAAPVRRPPSDRDRWVGPHP